MSDPDIVKRMKADPELVKRMHGEFMAGLEEGFAGVPMEFPEGIRELGSFQVIVGGPSDEIDPGQPGEISPNLDDEIIDAEIIE